MTPERLEKIRTVLARRQPDLTVVADEVHKGRNIAAIMRTCDAVGVDTVHLVHPKDGYRPYRGTALGTQKWVHTQLHETLQIPLEMLKRQGFQIVATSVAPGSRCYTELDYTRPTALLLGSEREGVSGYGQQQADSLITIPMVGMVESYNVSVATAIILMEAQRQRAAAGLYHTRRLPEAIYEARFFQWAHPEVARFCDERYLAYPEVGYDGEIEDPSGWYARVRGARQSSRGAY